MEQRDPSRPAREEEVINFKKYNPDETFDPLKDSGTGIVIPMSFPQIMQATRSNELRSLLLTLHETLQYFKDVFEEDPTKWDTNIPYLLGQGMNACCMLGIARHVDPKEAHNIDEWSRLTIVDALMGSISASIALVVQIDRLPDKGGFELSRCASDLKLRVDSLIEWLRAKFAINDKKSNKSTTPKDPRMN